MLGLRTSVQEGYVYVAFAGALASLKGSGAGAPAVFVYGIWWCSVGFVKDKGPILRAMGSALQPKS